jgi:sugar phosphate isomerase/epimerase
VGYHNHDAEWRPVEGQKPIEILAANTSKSVMLQLDVGTCLEAGSDPVAWINKNPGRIRSIHCKDWSPDKGYKVLFSEGVAPWKAIFAAAEASGGVEFYLIEQEGSRFPELETVRRCLEDYRKLRAA